MYLIFIFFLFSLYIMGTRGIVVVRYGKKIHSGYVSMGASPNDLGKRLITKLYKTKPEKSNEYAIKLAKKYASKVSDFPEYPYRDDFFKENTTMKKVNEEDFGWMYYVNLNNMKLKIKSRDYMRTFDLEKPKPKGWQKDFVDVS